MSQPFKLIFSSLLEVPFFSRVRRNHGLEHATLHVLAKRFPNLGLAGHSDMGGFWILGDVSTETLHDAVEEALGRLRAGDRNLAVHPNCGTNYATAGALAGIAGAASMLGAGRQVKDKLNRLPIAAILATLALVAAHPLGLQVQANVTTSGIPGSLEVTSITQHKQGKMTAHRIHTRG